MISVMTWIMHLPSSKPRWSPGLGEGGPPVPEDGTSERTRKKE